MNQIIRIVLAVPGVLQALVVDSNLWHVLAAHGLGSGVDDSEHPLSAQSRPLLLSGRLLRGQNQRRQACRRTEEHQAAIQVVLWRNRATYFAGGLPATSSTCCSVAKGAPVAFAAAVPDLLTFVRGPSVRGNKERLLAWLESKLEQAQN
ncbi:unnamed protein product [Ectocarpus sp. 6 AP-2014]